MSRMRHILGGHLHRRAIPVFATALALLGLTAAPASATKTHLPIETFGSAAQPTFGDVIGIAVDTSNGNLLVIDAKAQTVSRYHPDGTAADFSALGTNVIDGKGAGDGTPQGGFIFRTSLESSTAQVAVDNSGTLTDGNIYVTQGRQEAGNLIDVFSPSGEYIGQLKGAGGTAFGTGGGFPFSPSGVAVDGSGNLFVGAGFENKVYKFDPSANPPLSSDLTATYTSASPPPIYELAAGAGPSAGSVFAGAFRETNGNGRLFDVRGLSSAGLALQSVVDTVEEPPLLAVDEVTGHLYVEVGVGGTGGEVREFSGGSLVSSFQVNRGGFAVDGAAEKIYVGQTSPGNPTPIRVYGPLVSIPEVTTGTAAITGDTSATLNGNVDPDGVELEECFFDYGTTSAYGQTVPCAESPTQIGTAPKAVHAEVSGLAPETLYHFRLVAKNPNATVAGKDQTFRTPGKPLIKGVWAQDVGVEEGTIKAQINPENSPTTYRFEWGTDSSYGNSTAEIAIGSGEADRVVGRILTDLDSGTTYHYRVVATNGIGSTEGEDRTFITYPVAAPLKTDCPNQQFRTGASAALPDCRAYEMVSPVDKNGNDIKVLLNIVNFPVRLDQSSNDGNRFTYSSSTAFGDAASAPWSSQYLATRNEGVGWSTHSLNAPQDSVPLSDTPAMKFDTSYKLFDSGLDTGWLQQNAEPALDECAPPGFPNLYRRDIATGDYEALIPNEPLNSKPLTGGYRLELQGASADGTRTVFRANAKLTDDALDKNDDASYQLYMHVAGEGCGELRLLSIGPNGLPSSLAGSAGTPDTPAEYREGRMARAVSDDGSRVFVSLGFPGGPGSLYIRINADQEQSPVSGGKCTDLSLGCTLEISAAPAQFWTAAPDGSRMLYSVGSNLFEFDVDKALAGETASTLIAGGAGAVVEGGMAAASRDISRIYFVSREEIDGEGEEGERNLYLYEPGQSGPERYRFVATLDNLKGIRHWGFEVTSPQPSRIGVRVTDDGGHLAFVSASSPTGYDNADAADGRPNLEVYLYDAASEAVRCISCNPSGARPRGRRFEFGFSRQVSAMLPPSENQLFAPRALTADGNRLFFESFEALLPRDTNGKGDVYEWQRASGEQGCEEAGAELYVPNAGGCLSLISTGQSPVDSELADISLDGRDVFIRTQSSLLPQDNGLIDVYDARIGGGFAQPPTPPAACEGEACQGPLSAPDDPTPASSAFEGAGNVTAEKKPASCRKPKVKRKGRCVTRKAKKAPKHKRTQKSKGHKQKR